MTGTTTELGLATAVDGDDNADYLTISLKNGLQTIDALFNNATGHNHGASHQGGQILSVPISAIPDGSITSAKIADNTITGSDIAPGSIGTAQLANFSVTSGKLAVPVDIPGFFRTTASGTFPTTGVGLEMYYDGTQSVLQSYDRAAAAYKPALVVGSTLALDASGHTLAMDVSGNVSVPRQLTLNTERGTNQALNMRASASANDASLFAENGNVYVYFQNAGGQLFLQAPGSGGWIGMAAGSVTANGNILANGGLVQVGAADTYWQRSAPGAMATGASLSCSGNLSTGGTLTVTSYIQAGGGTYPGSGTIRLAAGNPIMWSGSGDLGIWMDASGYFNIKQGLAIANSATAGGIAKPATYRGFLQIQIAGFGLAKIPFYNP